MKLINKKQKGFTLLELLIVVAILAVLGAIVMFVLNPAETLKKTRDSQRISDLSTIKTALALFITSTSSPSIGGVGGSGNTLCKNGGGVKTIWYSVNGVASTTASGFVAATSSAGTPGYTDGAGWIPVNLDALIGGSPISNFPVDPVNTVILAPATSTDLVYRYTCDKNDLTFEINAQLESAEYAGMKSTDGGDTNLYFEVGTKIKNVLPTSTAPF